jgi:hypothetical protein
MLLHLHCRNKQAASEEGVGMMEFRITELMDEQACYDFLLGVLPPQGLHCPAGHKVARGPAPHMSDRAPLVD